MKISVGSLLAVALVAGGLLWYVTRHTGEPLSAWLASGKAEVQTVHTLLERHAAYVQRSSAQQHHWSDSVSRLVSALQVTHDAAASALASAKSTEDLRTAGATLAKANTACFNALTLCQAHGDSLFRADSAHADSLRQALRTADTTLARGLKVASCHVLLVLPCLSRTQSFELGAGLGIVGTLLIARRP